MCVDDVSISGYKDAVSEHSGAESASEVMVPTADGAVSPDAVSATSQSIDEPTKDLVSLCMCVCVLVSERGGVYDHSWSLVLEIFGCATFVRCLCDCL